MVFQTREDYRVNIGFPNTRGDYLSLLFSIIIKQSFISPECYVQTYISARLQLNYGDAVWGGGSSAPIDPSTFLLQVVLILNIGGFASSGLSVVRYRHFHETCLFIAASWNLYFSLLSLFEKMKVGLCDFHGFCVSVNPLLLTWIPGPVFTKLGMHIMLPEPIWTAYYINASRQSVCMCIPPIVARQRLGKLYPPYDW
jgi:hypothetical protein